MTKFNLDKLREIAKPRELSRAEEMALKAYPRDEDRELNFRRTNYRIAYKRGYKQAEKDLALTWEDVKEIVRIADGMMYSADSLADIEKRLGIQPYYTEVLTRYKQYKEGKQ